MRAAVTTARGVMEVADVGDPGAQGSGEVGVRPEAVAVAAIDRGAAVLLVDRVQSRLRRGQATGADVLLVEEQSDPVPAVLDWAGSDPPEVVFEASGAAEVARIAVELVARAGRVVVVGLGSADAPIRVGDLAFKEVDVLGVSCCNANEFADAVSLVGRRRDVLGGLVTHEFPLERAPEAI